MDEETARSPRRWKAGRPPARPEDRRTYMIAVRVNAQERAELERRRSAAGYRELGAYLRTSVLAQKPPRARTPAVNVAAWQELARSAANLNQLTAHLNGGGHLDARGTAHLADVLEAMSGQIRALRLALMRGGEDEGDEA